MRMLALDPGGTTGWVLHEMLEEKNPELPLKVSGGQLGPDEHHAELHALLDDEDPDVVVCEEFTYRIVSVDGIQMPGVNLISKEYIGVIKLWVQEYPDIHTPELYLPMSSEAVGKFAWWDNDRLQAMGVYTKGEPHRNDATRHLLTHILNVRKRRDYLWGFKPM